MLIRTLPLLLPLPPLSLRTPLLKSTPLHLRALAAFAEPQCADRSPCRRRHRRRRHHHHRRYRRRRRRVRHFARRRTL